MRKIPASSLLEVLVSGVLLCIIISVSVVIFVNVTSSAPSFREHQLDVLLHARINAIRKEVLTSWEKTDTVLNGANLVETVRPFQNTNALFIIDLRVMDVHGKVEAQASALHYQYEQDR